MKAVMAVHILVSPKLLNTSFICMVSPKLLNTSFICMVFFYYDAKSRHHCPQIYSPVYMAFCCTFFLSKGVSRLTICFAFYRLVYMLAFYRLYIYICTPAWEITFSIGLGRCAIRQNRFCGGQRIRFYGQRIRFYRQQLIG